MSAAIITLFFLSLILLAGTLILRWVDSKPDGLLNVDMRDPDKDYYDFVFLIPTGDIPKKKFLKIEVKVKS